jgi:MoaA/NifB/PqqE/SkfB family radical SAM enzyme
MGPMRGRTNNHRATIKTGTLLVLPAHFVPAKSREDARALFARSIKQVEIEVFSYCNRTCWFCPNSTIDRRSENHFMDEGLYLRILAELAEIDYRGVITYSRYNEPLADRIILERIRQAHRLLPSALLSTHTNGDYLTRTYLDELRDAGLSRILIMNYLGNNEQFSDKKVLSRMLSKAVDLGLRAEFLLAEAGIRYVAELAYEGMNVQLDGRNYAATGTDRGKLVHLEPYVRTSWCPVVFDDLYIDWNGKVVPCCNIRSDAPEHSQYIVADLTSGTSIFEAWASGSLVEWRKSLFNFSPKSAPCDSCRYALMPDDEGSRAFVDRISRFASAQNFRAEQ